MLFVRNGVLCRLQIFSWHHTNSFSSKLAVIRKLEDTNVFFQMLFGASILASAARDTTVLWPSNSNL